MVPDLVCVARYNTANSLELLERTGLPVYRNDTVHTLDEIESGIRQLGERVGEPGRARELAGRMHARRQALAGRVCNVSRRPRVLFWAGVGILTAFLGRPAFLIVLRQSGRARP